jgi:hypothetical protein
LSSRDWPPDGGEMSKVIKATDWSRTGIGLGDEELTVKALQDGKQKNDISVVCDGEDALCYLRRQGRHEKALRPDQFWLEVVHLAKCARLSK